MRNLSLRSDFTAALLSLAAAACSAASSDHGAGGNQGADMGSPGSDSGVTLGSDGGTRTTDSGGASMDSGSASTDAGGSSTDGSANAGDATSESDASVAGLFAGCSMTGGCMADCSPPASDPLATGMSGLDLYDGCLLAGMRLANMTDIEQVKLLKAQAYNESGISPVITTNDNTCGGQNCGIWAISAGTVSGDSPPGPCGSSAVDKFTGAVDYSHSYGLFQSTPACDGVFALTKTLPQGTQCTGTTEANNIPFGTTIDFYCESATSNTDGSYIDAVQDTTNPLYALSAFNPAYQIYVYFAQWPANFQQANASATGCTTQEQWYLTLAYWLTGDASTSCTLSDQTGSGNGQDYVLTAIQDYEMLYGSTWPYPSP
jgi:hypothetical protein